MTADRRQSFDGAAAIFNAHAKTLRGYVRYQVVQRNLESWLTKKPMRVLDIGGGSGCDAAWLASLGHTVTLLESSKVQCNAAQSRFNFFLSTPQRKRITIINGSFSDLSKTDTNFDLVLMHGVAMYQTDPAAFITQAAGLVRKGGLFSLVEKSYYGVEARVIRRGETERLKDLQATHRISNGLNLTVQAFTPEDLETILSAAKAKTMDWFGVRVITDEMFEAVANIDEQTLAEIVDAEYEQGRNHGIRAQGQMLHFIARKQ